MSKPLSCLSNSHPFPSDLAAIAATLTQASQALLAFAGTRQTVEQSNDAGGETALQADESSGQGVYNDAVRCFRLPHFTVRREQELLQQYKQESFFSLVNCVYDDLFATLLLMRHLDDSAKFSGFELHLISESLSRPLGLLDTICSQLADYEPVQKN